MIHEIGGISVRVIKQTASGLSLNASITGAGIAAGMASFALGADGRLICELMHVEPLYRRKGLATAMHHVAESHFGKTVLASLQLTEDSVAFYRARGVSIPANAEVKSYDAWFGYDDVDRDDDDCDEEGGPSVACRI